MFKVEIEVAVGIIITKVYHADSLGDLGNQVYKEFPKGKVVSIIGG